MTDRPLRRALVALGSNIQPQLHLRQAVRRLAELGRVRAASQVWQSQPVGFVDQDDFLNAAVMFDTDLDGPALRLALRQLEHELGRVRDPANKNGPRTIDLDLVLLGGQRGGGWQVFDAEIAGQAFLAVPLAELAPQLVLPGDGRTLQQLAGQLTTASLRLREDICLNSAAAVQSDMPVPDQTTLSQRSPLASKQGVPLSSLWLQFCYGHRLLNYDGKCRHLHGHSARAELQLESVESVDRLQSQMEAWVRQELDSRMILSRQDPALKSLRELGEPVYVIDTNPTTENLARLIFERGLELGLPLTQVRLWESPRCSATYRGGLR